MNFGKKIELFLVDGTVNGIVTAILGNWSGEGIKISRTDVSLCNRDDLKKIGIYFLFCDDNGFEKVYVGEAENILERLKTHIKDYENGREAYYWNKAVAFVDERLDKAEVRYIENQLVEIIKNIDESKIITKNTYKNTTLKESQKAVANEFIENIKILLGVLGFDTLTKVGDTSTEPIYLYCKGKDAEAQGYVSQNGFTVLKNSKISSEVAASFKKFVYNNLREELILKKIIVNNKFVKNYEFKAPSLLLL